MDEKLALGERRVTELEDRYTKARGEIAVGNYAAAAHQLNNQSLVPDLEREIATMESDAVGRQFEATSGDREKVSALTKTFKKRLEAYDFEGALRIAKATRVSSPDAVMQREKMIKRARWLSNFKCWLTEKFPEAAYRGRLAKRSGGIIPGDIRQATGAVNVVSLRKNQRSMGGNFTPYPPRNGFSFSANDAQYTGRSRSQAGNRSLCFLRESPESWKEIPD